MSCTCLSPIRTRLASMETHNQLTAAKLTQAPRLLCTTPRSDLQRDPGLSAEEWGELAPFFTVRTLLEGGNWVGQQSSSESARKGPQLLSRACCTHHAARYPS